MTSVNGRGQGPELDTAARVASHIEAHGELIRVLATLRRAPARSRTIEVVASAPELATLRMQWQLWDLLLDDDSPSSDELLAAYLDPEEVALARYALLADEAPDLHIVD